MLSITDIWLTTGLAAPIWYGPAPDRRRRSGAFQFRIVWPVLGVKEVPSNRPATRFPRELM